MRGAWCVLHGACSAPGTHHALEPLACFRIAQGHSEDLRLEPLSLAGVAELRAHEPFEPVQGELALALLIEPLEVGNHALKRAADLARFARAPEGELDFGLPRTPEQHALEIRRKRFVGHLHALLVMLCHTAEEAFVIAHHALAASPPGQNCALFERLVRVGHHQALVEDQLLTQPMAHRARARRGIE